MVITNAENRYVGRVGNLESSTCKLALFTPYTRF